VAATEDAGGPPPPAQGKGRYFFGGAADEVIGVFPPNGACFGFLFLSAFGFFFSFGARI
jgi:hypothetical protein